MAVIENPSSIENTAGGQPLPQAAFILMGKTGAGKSSFIKLLGGTDVITGKEPKVDSSIDSCTQTATTYNVTMGNRRVLLIDTPGFDDSTKGNAAPLRDLLSHLWLLARNQEKSLLYGVIFLHDIGEVRLSSSQRITLSILKHLCGPLCMKNVIVGTTMWVPENKKRYLEQEKREGEILKENWGGIHSTVRLFEDDRDAAAGIINTLLSASPVLLQAQQEILQSPNHLFSETTVWRELSLGAEEAGEGGFFGGFFKRARNPADWTFAEKFGAAIAAPIILAPAALVAAPVGVIYAAVHGVDHFTKKRG